MSDWPIWMAFCGCLIVSWLLSGMEAGVFALSRMRVGQQMRAGRTSARVLHHYLEHPENFLWTIVVGNTLANFCILGWTVVTLHRALGKSIGAFIAVYAVQIFAFYVLFDLLPKTLFKTYPNRLCLLVARPFGLIHGVLRPIVAIVESVSTLMLRWRGTQSFTGRLFGNREELRFLMQESSQSLSTDEKILVNRVLDFQSLSVRQAMIPIFDVATLESDATVGDALNKCRETRHTRFPVWGERDRRKKIIGILSANTLLYHLELADTKPIGPVIKPALFLDEDARLETALRRLQKGGHRMAIVLNRERKDVGIITLQDILKGLFGEVSL